MWKIFIITDVITLWSQWEMAIGGLRVIVPQQTPEWLPGQVPMARAPKRLQGE